MKLLLVPILLAASAQIASAADCTPIRFAKGASSATVRGVVPVEGNTCFTLGVGAGQKAHIRFKEGPGDIAVTVVGVGDNRSSIDFTTKAGTYELLVHQTFRSVAPAPFAMFVSVK